MCTRHPHRRPDAGDALASLAALAILAAMLGGLLMLAGIGIYPY